MSGIIGSSPNMTSGIVGGQSYFMDHVIVKLNSTLSSVSGTASISNWVLDYTTNASLFSTNGNGIQPTRDGYYMVWHFSYWYNNSSGYIGTTFTRSTSGNISSVMHDNNTYGTRIQTTRPMKLVAGETLGISYTIGSGTANYDNGDVRLGATFLGQNHG